MPANVILQCKHDVCLQPDWHHVPATRQALLTVLNMTPLRPSVEHMLCCRAKLKEFGFQPEKVAQLVSRTFNEMVFIHGDVHCDPHAANLFLRKHPVDGSMQLVLLDHGLYRYVLIGMSYT